MTYPEAVARLYSLERWGIKLGLENIRQFCEYLGNPQDAFQSIHIAGTNGKGSVTALVDSILRGAGYRVGRYTSPHLRDFRERIQISGIPLSRARFVRFMNQHWKKIHRGRYSYFETATALAYDAFAGARVQYGVMEVGLGGRFDATNTLNPALSVITHIDFDHESTLGNTLRKIATEKAGIIKTGVPVIVGPLPEPALHAITRIAQERSAPLFTAEQILSAADLPRRELLRRTRWTLPLLGTHQAANLGVALAALLMLPCLSIPLSAGQLRRGARRVHWPARFQVIPGTPTVVFDAAHNPSGMDAFAKTWPRVFGRRRAVALFTAREDKNFKRMWRALAPRVSAWIGCPLPHSPGIAEPEMRNLALASGTPFQWAETAAAGFRRAKELAGRDGVCVVAGSHYLVGEVIPAKAVTSPAPVASPLQFLSWDSILASLRASA